SLMATMRKLASLISNRIRRLQLAFFVEAHHRDAQKLCSLTLRDVLLGQGSINQLIEKPWMLLWQRITGLVLAPAPDRKPFDHRQVKRIGDHTTLLGPLQPSGHRQPELVFERIQLLPFQCVTLLSQQMNHRHTRGQESASEAVTRFLLVKTVSETPLEQQMPQLVGQGEALPVSGPELGHGHHGILATIVGTRLR